MARAADTTRWPELWRDLVVIHRLQYPLPVIYLSHAVLGASVAAGALPPMLDADVLAAVLANLLLSVSGLALNNAVDVRTDERHRDKNYLSDAVRRIGRARTLRLAAAETAVGLALAAGISVRTGHWLVAGTAAAIVLLHLAYNVEPVRLKRRGFAGPIVFGICCDALPCLLAFGAVRAALDLPAGAVFLGIALLAIGRTTWWAAPDLAADTASGIATPMVRYGLTRTLGLCCAILIAGQLVLGWGLWLGFGPLWTLPGLALHVVFLGAALVLLRRVRGGAAPNAVYMLRRRMPLVMVGEVILVIIPLVA